MQSAPDWTPGVMRSRTAGLVTSPGRRRAKEGEMNNGKYAISTTYSWRREDEQPESGLPRYDTIEEAENELIRRQSQFQELMWRTHWSGPLDGDTLTVTIPDGNQITYRIVTAPA